MTFKDKIKKMFPSVSRSDNRLVNQLENGIEVPDPEPAFIPTGLAKQEGIQQMIRRMIRTEASLHAQSEGMETFEEADDFDVGDDDMPHSQYEFEEDFDPLPDPLSQQPTEGASEGEQQPEVKPADQAGSSEA